MVVCSRSVSSPPMNADCKQLLRGELFCMIPFFVFFFFFFFLTQYRQVVFVDAYPTHRSGEGRLLENARQMACKDDSAPRCQHHPVRHSPAIVTLSCPRERASSYNSLPCTIQSGPIPYSLAAARFPVAALGRLKKRIRKRASRFRQTRRSASDPEFSMPGAGFQPLANRLRPFDQEGFWYGQRGEISSVPTPSK